MASWHSSGRTRWDQQIVMGLLLTGSLVAAVLLVQLLLPWLLLGGLGAIALGIWQRYRQRDRQRHLIFYELIQQRGGRISALDFAMTAQLTGLEARRFLNARAQEFYGNFEATAHGDVLYTFDARDFSGQSPPPPASGPDFSGPDFSGPDSSGLTEACWLSLTDPLADQTSSQSLTLEELATRLNCSVTLLQQRKWAADFAYWSQERDPAGQPWRIDPISDRAYRLE